MNQVKTIFKITTPENNEIEIAAMDQLLTSLYSIKTEVPATSIFDELPSIAFEIVGVHENISIYMVVPKEFEALAEKQVYAAYPTARVEQTEPWDIWETDGYVSYAKIKPTGKDYYPFRVHDDFSVDPLNGLTSPMSKLKPGEGVCIQFLARPSSGKWVSNGRNYIQGLEYAAMKEGAKPIKKDNNFMEALEKKLTKHGYEVVINLVAVAQDKKSADNLIKVEAASLQQFGFPNYTGIKKAAPTFEKRFMDNFLKRSFPRLADKFILNTLELATMIHFPNKNVTTPHIVWDSFKTGAAPTNVPQNGMYLGTSIHHGKEKKIYQLEDDRRRHTYIIGQTGTGKSELLKFLALQDIRNGHGVAFIDPHGEAIEDLLAQIPRHRALDVIYFNPSDLERPMGLNFMDVETEEQKHYVINSFIALLYKLYDPNRHGIMGPILERAIRNTMLTAMSEPGNTMVEVLRLITDEKFVQLKLPLVRDPLVRRYWTDQIAKTANKEKSEHLGYFTSKFDRFVTEKLMRNIVGQSKSAFNLREIMDNKKILLVNLAKGKIGEENSNFLGLILIPRILAAALSRGDTIDKEQMPDFYLYVDEFQNFATDAFATMLSEVRKYKLSLTVANQYISQLSEEIRNAVFGNVGTFITFRVGASDAEFIEPQLAPRFDKNDLMNSAVGNAYAKILMNNQPSVPFSLVTDWNAMKNSPRDFELAQKIKDFSRLQYGRDVKGVEREIRFRSNL